jgi:hypothetical protein
VRGTRTRSSEWRERERETVGYNSGDSISRGDRPDMDRMIGGLDRWRNESKDEPCTDQERCGRNQWRGRRTEEGTTGGCCSAAL